MAGRHTAETLTGESKSAWIRVSPRDGIRPEASEDPGRGVIDGNQRLAIRSITTPVKTGLEKTPEMLPLLIVLAPT